MNWLKSSLCILALLSLAGCVGTQQQRVEPSQPVTIAVPTPPLTDMTPVENLRQEVSASANTTSNAITGLGLQVSKVAEKVQGFGGDLAKITTQVEANATATATLRAALNAEITTTLQTQATAHATAIATLTSKIEAMTNGQMALKAQVDQSSEVIKSGRDTVQFTKEMMETLKASYEAQIALSKNDNNTLYWTVLGLAGCFQAIIFAVLKSSRDRADARAEELKKHVFGGREHAKAQ